jgi:membrane associated rhomboid family serine protease
MNFLGQEPVYSCIIGASGIVYMLAFFLFFSGIFRKNKVLLTVALLVALYYGSLIGGFSRRTFYKLDQPSKISWQAHLSGAIVGLSLALIFKNKHREKNKKFIWEFPNYYSEKDDKLWQDYT